MKKDEKSIKDLKKKLLLFKLFADHSFAWETFRDKDRKIIYISPSFEKITGYKLEEYVKGQITLKNIIHPDDYENVRLLFDHAFTKMTTEDIEFRIIRKDKTIISASVSYQPVYDENNTYIGIRSSIIDISKQKKLQDALLESEKIFSYFMKYSPVYMFFKDKDIKAIRVSDNFKKMTGKPISEIIGKTMNELFPSELAKSMIEDDKKILEDGRPLEIIEELNGRYYKTIKFPIFKDGKPEYLAGFNIDITEQKITEESLIESEEKYRILTESTNDIIWILDTETLYFTYVSPSIQKIMGYAPEEYSSKPIGHSATPESRLKLNDRIKKRCENLISGLYTSEKFYSDEVQQICKDGRKIWTEVITRYYLNERTGHIEAHGITRDITEKKRAEDALERRILALTQPLEDVSNLRFEDLFNIEEIQQIQDSFALATGVGSLITDTEGKPITKPSNFSYLCENLIRKTQKGLENCIKSDTIIGARNPEGPTIKRCLSGGLWDAGANICVGERHIANWLVGQVLESETKKEEMLKYAYEIGADETEFRKALNKITIMPLEQFNRIAQALYLIANQLSILALQNVQQAREITNRRKVERSLQEERNREHMYLDIAKVMMLALDIDGNIIMINKKGCEILDYSENEIIGKNWFDIALPPEMKMEVKNVFSKIISGEMAYVEYYENPVITKNGKQRLIAFHNAVLYDKSTKSITGVLSSGEDITEKKIAEEEHLRLQNLESLGMLAGGIAHDFNNILSTILGRASIALDDVHNDSIRNDLLAIEKASKRAVGLTQQLLTFAKGGAPEKCVINVRKIIRETTEFSLSGSNVSPVFDFNDSFQTEADPGQIAQVIQNLIINAKQAMPSGGNITISTNDHLLPSGDKYLKITIKDEGIGIQKDYLKRIFDPYFTTKQTGSGLGLSVCHSIISRHGGKISVNSELSKGTTFTILLQATEKKESQKEKSETVIPQKLNILIMDDEEEIRDLLFTLLSKLGHSVTTAKDGSESLDIYKKSKETGNRFDLVFMDLTVKGGMGGREAVRLLREFDPIAKVVVSSGYADTSISNYKDDGFDGVLKKPYTKQDLINIISQIITK
jgi:PAS domain S-box-containing protein